MHFLQPIRNDICSKYFTEHLLSRHSGSICGEKLPVEYKYMVMEYSTHWFLWKSYMLIQQPAPNVPSGAGS